jgi:uncharacterized protein (TIGR03067 family)
MNVNTKLLAVGLLILFSVMYPFVYQATAETSDKELNKFQGTWVMVSGDWDGKKIADADVSKSKIAYEGNKGQLTAPHQSKETIFFDIIKLDPSKSPNEFDLIRRTGPSAGKTIKAIYEFDGNDQFKFAFDPTAATTPKEFSAKKGTGYILQIWKRVKP